MKMSFYSHENKTHFHKKCFGLSPILKVKVVGILKWRIRMLKSQLNLNYIFAFPFSTSIFLFVFPFWNRKDYFLVRVTSIGRGDWKYVSYFSLEFVGGSNATSQNTLFNLIYIPLILFICCNLWRKLHIKCYKSLTQGYLCLLFTGTLLTINGTMFTDQVIETEDYNSNKEVIERYLTLT